MSFPVRQGWLQVLLAGLRLAQSAIRLRREQARLGQSGQKLWVFLSAQGGYSAWGEHAPGQEAEWEENLRQST
jgi:hypothetical protein